jgi:hypothetical protein
MFKRFLSFTLLVFIAQTFPEHDSNAKTWPPGSKALADTTKSFISISYSILYDSVSFKNCYFTEGLFLLTTSRTSELETRQDP